MKIRPEIREALMAVYRIHGQGAKEAIFSSWFYGSYFVYGLSEYAEALQRLRCTYDGYDFVQNLNFADLS